MQYGLLPLRDYGISGRGLSPFDAERRMFFETIRNLLNKG
ncbi:hypothetical protein WCP94_000506 (plasmid) [Bilophila wadsworthia]